MDQPNPYEPPRAPLARQEGGVRLWHVLPRVLAVGGIGILFCLLGLAGCTFLGVTALIPRPSPADEFVCGEPVIGAMILALIFGGIPGAIIRLFTGAYLGALLVGRPACRSLEVEDSSGDRGTERIRREILGEIRLCDQLIEQARQAGDDDVVQKLIHHRATLEHEFGASY